MKKKLKSSCPSDATPCSPSSLTPETDEAWKAVSRTPDGMYDSRVPISAFAYAMSRHSKKMERERDEARARADINARDWQRQCLKSEDLRRERDEARAESIRWHSIAEGRGRTDECNDPDHGAINAERAESKGLRKAWVELDDKKQDLEKQLATVTAQRDEAREIAAEACAMLADNGFETNYPPMPWDSDSPENDKAHSRGGKS